MSLLRSLPGTCGAHGAQTGMCRLVPGSGHPNFYIWQFKKYGDKVSLALLKWFPVLNEGLWKGSLSLKWVNNFFFFPNKGHLQKRCQRRPALYHSGRSARHQEGHAGSQTGQWGKGVVKMYLVSSGCCQQVVCGTHHLECMSHFGFFWFRWSTEPSTGRREAMG